MQDEKIASNRKRAVTHTKVAAWVIAGMVMIAGGIIVVVLTRDSQPPGAVAQGQQPITDQSTTTPHADAAAPETPPPPPQEAAADDRSSAEVGQSQQEPAEDTQAEKLPTWRLSKEVYQADKILRAAGWRFESFESLGEYLPGQYWLEYSRSVDGPQLAVGLMGNDSRMLGVALNGFVGSISSSAQYSEAKRKVWELFLTTAKALIPDVEQAVAESRATAIGRGYWQMWSEGQSFTASGWRVSTRDYQDGYRQRPRQEGDWLLTLHISRD